MKRTRKLLLGLGFLALLLAGSAAAASGATTAGASASSCKPAADIEAIVDDSGSMAITDPNRLRVQAMNLLIDTLSPTTQLGAVEFGSGYPRIPARPPTRVFPPEPVGPNAAAMRSALDQKINADNGATDYNAAFAQADADNPGADARIFLTDGGHDVGTYNEAHLDPQRADLRDRLRLRDRLGRRPGAPEEDRRRHRRPVLPAAGREPAAGGDEQHRRRAHLPDAAAAVHRPAQTGPEQDPQRRHRRRHQIDPDRPHLGQPARRLQALRPASSSPASRPSRSPRGRAANRPSSRSPAPRARPSSSSRSRS